MVYNMPGVTCMDNEMNERIKDCMFNAGLNSNYVEGFNSIYSKQLEKFAELIIRECMNVLHDNELWNRHISHALNEHFGVE